MIIVLTTALVLAITASIYLAIELGKLKNEIEDRQMVISALQRQTEKDSRVIKELKMENELLSKKSAEASKTVATETPKQAPRRSRKPKQATKQA
jgi:cell division protein FtsB